MQTNFDLHNYINKFSHKLMYKKRKFNFNTLLSVYNVLLLSVKIILCVIFKVTIIKLILLFFHLTIHN